MTPITRDEIEELERLHNEATPIPWMTPHFSSSSSKCKCRYVLCETLMGAICTIHSANDDGTNDGDDPPKEEAIANGALISAVRNALPRLIARIREFEGENAKLREAIQDAGWSVMQTSGKWSIHSVTEKAKRAEEVEARVIGENVDLMRRVGELEAALKPFASIGNVVSDRRGYDDADGIIDIVTGNGRGKITIGDCRIAAAVLAKGEANAR